MSVYLYMYVKLYVIYVCAYMHACMYVVEGYLFVSWPSGSSDPK